MTNLKIANEINDIIKKCKKEAKFSHILYEELYHKQTEEIDNKLQILCEGNIFYIGKACDQYYVVAKESKYIKKLKETIKQNKLDIYCCSLSEYQINYLHHISFRSKHLKTEKCGCFHCLSIFNSKELDEVIDGIGGWCDYGETPICPYCGVDSVLFEGKNLKITRKLLYDIELRFFGRKFNLKNWKKPEKPILLTVD